MIEANHGKLIRTSQEMIYRKYEEAGDRKTARIDGVATTSLNSGRNACGKSLVRVFKRCLNVRPVTVD